jgi:hypothetical protein
MQDALKSNNALQALAAGASNSVFTAKANLMQENKH